MILLFLLAFPVQAAWQGKIDLSLPVPIVIRELHDGNWLAGLSKQFWHLDQDGKERLHVSLWNAWRADHGDSALGLSLGVNTGQLGEMIQNMVSAVAPNLTDHAKWIKTLANWISVDFYSGYRFTHSPDVHSWVYGIGGKVKIPLNLK